MKDGSMVELIEDTEFYKKGQRAVVVDMCGNHKAFNIRYEGERYWGGDVDVMPKHLFREVKE